MIERVVALVVIAGIIAFFGYIVVAGIIAGTRLDRRPPRRTARRIERDKLPAEDQDAAE